MNDDRNEADDDITIQTEETPGTSACTTTSDVADDSLAAYFADCSMSGSAASDPGVTLAAFNARIQDFKVDEIIQRAGRP
jgi:hypothetical protein